MTNTVAGKAINEKGQHLGEAFQSCVWCATKRRLEALLSNIKLISICENITTSTNILVQKDRAHNSPKSKIHSNSAVAARSAHFFAETKSAESAIFNFSVATDVSKLFFDI